MDKLALGATERRVERLHHLLCRTRLFVHHRVVFGSGQINRKMNGQDFCHSLLGSSVYLPCSSGRVQLFTFCCLVNIGRARLLRRTVGELCTFAPSPRPFGGQIRREEERKKNNFFCRRTIDRVEREKIMWKMSKRETN